MNGQNQGTGKKSLRYPFLKPQSTYVNPLQHGQHKLRNAAYQHTGGSFYRAVITLEEGQTARICLSANDQKHRPSDCSAIDVSDLFFSGNNRVIDDFGICYGRI